MSRVRRCQCVEESGRACGNAAEWVMQPFGPDPRVMIVPEGEQAAGYAVVRVCFGHRLLYNQGRPLRFGHGRGERREVWVVQGGERERVLGLGDLTVVDSETARWPLERRDG